LPEWLRSLLKIVGIFFSFLVVAGVSAYVAILVLVPRENIPVPEVVGRQLKEAVFILSKSELSVRVVGKRFSANVPEDVVISQIPPPGTRVRKGRTIELVVSGGARLLAVPSLVGMKVREAKLYLSQIGVKVLNITHVCSRLPQDEVIAQDPPAGSEIRRDEGVNLLVSSGPRVLKLMVPDLRGKKVEDAVNFIKKIPLSISMIKEQVSPEKEGIVISQSPLPGSMVDENTGIELTVSTTLRKSTSSVTRQKWVLVSVQIPVGFEQKKVTVVINDKEGKKILDYGTHPAGEKLWISCEVIGKGEVMVYVGDKLVKFEKVEVNE